MTSAIPPLSAPSIGRLLADRAAETPGAEFLRFERASLTFAQANLASTAVAAALGRLGITAGDRVAIMLPNGLDYPVVWLGVVRLGAVVVPCNTGYRERDLGHLLKDSAARLIVTDAERLTLVREVAALCPALERTVEVGEIRTKPGAEGPAAWRDDAIGPGQLATLQYTSGTTGFPKGCMLTHEYWLRLAANVAAGVNLTSDDVVMIMTPWFYMDAAWNMLLCCMKGIPLVILRRFSASTFWESVIHNGVTFFYCLGTMPTVLLKQPPHPELERNHRVRAVLCSAIPRDQHATIEARFGCPWRETYSTTETGPVLLSVPLEDASTVGSGAVGRPSPAAEARLADAAGREVTPGSAGELQMRGPGMMQGYWNNPEATAAWLRGGWAHTGDIATKDDRGYYHLVGRLKEMIRRGGENISAAEVEATLAEHPAVHTAACVPVPDEIRGEEVKAFIQLQPGATVEPETLLELCRVKLAAFKVPRYLAFIDRFPLTPSERVEKHRLDRTRHGAYDATTRTWN